ncbi:MAG: AIR synthase family protein [Bacillota bacterium]
MRSGKISPRILRGFVLRNLGHRRDEVVVPAAFGEDASVLDLGGAPVVISTDPITAAQAGAGRLAVIVSCNDVAAGGAEPVGVLLTIILPADSEPELLRRIMGEAHEAAKELGVAIIGGHTEVAPYVSQPILSTTVVGKALPDLPYWPITSSAAKPGDRLLLTKVAGVEGSTILATDFRDVLLARGVSEESLEEAETMAEWISVVPEALAAAQAGARAMHDVTEGGIVGATYEIAAASGRGAILYEDRIPVARVTREFCEVLELDPLRLISSGSLLMATPEPDAVIGALKEIDIRVTEIGRITEDEELALVRQLPGGGEVWMELTPPERDELWRAVEMYR